MSQSLQHSIPAFQDHLRLRGLALSSIAEHSRDLLTLSRYLPGPAAGITGERLQAALGGLLRDRRLKNVSFNRKLTSYRLFFEFLQERGGISESPAESVSFAKRIKNDAPSFLTCEQAQALLLASEHNPLHNTIIHTFYELGIRLSELAGLQIGDVDSSSMQVRVLGKGGRVRQVHFGRELLLKLRQAVKGPRGYRQKGFLFLQPHGAPFSASGIQRLIRVYAGKAGLLKPVSPRTLRHTHATHALEAGVDLFSLKKSLGHRDLASTLVYTHVADSSSRSAHEKFLAYAFNG